MNKKRELNGFKLLKYTKSELPHEIIEANLSGFDKYLSWFNYDFREKFCECELRRFEIFCEFGWIGFEW